MRYITVILLLFLLVSCGVKQAEPKVIEQPIQEAQPELNEQPEEQEAMEELSKPEIITQDDNSSLLYTAIGNWLGVPYKKGGMSKRGVDCSALVVLVYQEVYGKTLSRTTNSMFQSSTRLKRSELQEGDLVFFHTRHNNKKTVNHVGIYLKEDKFVHASSSKGVMVSSLDNPYFQRVWISGGKVK
ncbi:MAG: C40 family peptidase [Campylobacteraceae bacterium]|jgi:cell wall-associated NlpC family hydrolase|nr:C40 family peptidase [Campylobacteraceae bacterium]